ncbi:methyltransferase domain-containing protein [Bernardetia sp. Wsw4-3y2]|uniref:methyltransferase domain-containing protein n=1 Tax=Bernardetia sp. Wsw4-3y2 TaxID=3127471 RepID=UPI0030CEB131
MTKDSVFNNPQQVISDFEFNKSVVTVFDDMVVRSVPNYVEIQRMIAELTKDYATPNSTIYDLGCSTGATLISLETAKLDTSISFVGIDNSEEMLKKCQSNIDKLNSKRTITLEFQNLDADLNCRV